MINSLRGPEFNCMTVCQAPICSTAQVTAEEGVYLRTSENSGTSGYTVLPFNRIPTLSVSTCVVVVVVQRFYDVIWHTGRRRLSWVFYIIWPNGSFYILYIFLLFFSFFSVVFCGPQAFFSLTYMFFLLCSSFFPWVHVCIGVYAWVWRCACVCICVCVCEAN